MTYWRGLSQSSPNLINLNFSDPPLLPGSSVTCSVLFYSLSFSAEITVAISVHQELLFFNSSVIFF
jgi:hypothetical protein